MYQVRQIQQNKTDPLEHIRYLTPEKPIETAQELNPEKRKTNPAAALRDA
jgi:hypothetical protein